mmetsp:Transcript_40046/g.72146  ORF Transcript_40046/g.72146 Transcript_40046/m.72146 type:complete len:106 (-) Transcript_40046:43-360(-)
MENQKAALSALTYDTLSSFDLGNYSLYRDETRPKTKGPTSAIDGPIYQHRLKATASPVSWQWSSESEGSNSMLPCPNRLYAHAVVASKSDSCCMNTKIISDFHPK